MFTAPLRTCQPRSRPVTSPCNATEFPTAHKHQRASEVLSRHRHHKDHRDICTLLPSLVPRYRRRKTERDRKAVLSIPSRRNRTDGHQPTAGKTEQPDFAFQRWSRVFTLAEAQRGHATDKIAFRHHLTAPNLVKETSRMARGPHRPRTTALDRPRSGAGPHTRIALP